MVTCAMRSAMAATASAAFAVACFVILRSAQLSFADFSMDSTFLVCSTRDLAYDTSSLNARHNPNRAY